MSKGVLDVWPLPGPPRNAGDPLGPHDARTQTWHSVVMFVALVFPTLNWNRGGTLREFVQMVLPLYGSRNREWVETLALPNELWPYVSNLNQGGVHHFLENVPPRLLSTVEEWCFDQNSVHNRTTAVEIEMTVDIFHNGWYVMFFDKYSNMATSSRRSMVCRHCMARGHPGYLLLLNDANWDCGCLLGGRLKAPTQCHRCGYQECFLCALEKNKADWTTWPPSIPPSVTNSAPQPKS